MKKILVYSLTCFLFVFNSNAQTTVTIPLSQGNGEDAYLASGTPNSNFGSHPSIGGNTWTCSSALCNSRGVFKFDLSSIPAGAIITNASLQLFADLNWSSTPTTGASNGGYLYRITSGWTENVVTWNSQPTTTSSNMVTIPASTSTAQNYTLNVTNLVQDMVTNTNYGFLLKMQDEANYYKALMFASSDNADQSKCPILTVSYTTVSVTTTSISLCQGNSEDAYLASGTPNSNFGSHPSIGGNTWTCSGVLCNSRGVFKFDLSSVPTGASIINASLQLFADLNWSSSPTTGTSNSGYLMRVTSPWTENAVTWNTQPTSSVVNQVIIPASTGSAENYTLNVTNLLQDIISNTNYGFMLKMQDEVNYYKALMFASSDNADPSKCPILTISYQNSLNVKDLTQKSNINVYPNPSTEGFNIISSQILSRISVYNMVGELQVEDDVHAFDYYLRKELSPGIYYMTVYTETNTPYTLKIVKN